MDRRTVSTALSRGHRASLDGAETDDFSALEVLAEGTGAWLSHLPGYAGIALLLHAALRRSEKLTGGVRTQVLGICLVIWSIAVGLMLFSGLHKGGSVGSTIWIVVYLCTRALDTSLAAVLSAMTYHHLCDRPDAG